MFWIGAEYGRNVLFPDQFCIIFVHIPYAEGIRQALLNFALGLILVIP